MVPLYGPKRLCSAKSLFALSWSAARYNLQKQRNMFCSWSGASRRQCICVIVYLCNDMFVYFSMCVFVYLFTVGAVPGGD